MDPSKARKELFRRIKQAWAADTSSDPERWSGNDRAHGQQAATALVVHQKLGGDIIIVGYHRDGITGEHFCNLLPDGTYIDLTREQHPEDTEFFPTLPAPGLQGTRLSDGMAEQLRGATEIALHRQGHTGATVYILGKKGAPGGVTYRDCYQRLTNHMKHPHMHRIGNILGGNPQGKSENIR